MNTLLFALGTGIGATLVSDVWGFARKPLLGVPPPDYGLVGRWIGHMPAGRFHHDAIARAPAIHAENMLGWCVHYAIGIAYAALLVLIGGPTWMNAPTLGLAIMVGIVTIAAPFLLMQPAMGAGFAASRTPRPNSARLQSLLFHTVFGLGLYASARMMNLLFPD